MTETLESASMTWTDLVGSIGGASGVFLGASLVTLLEALAFAAAALCPGARAEKAEPPRDVRPPWRLPRPSIHAPP